MSRPPPEPPVLCFATEVVGVRRLSPSFVRLTLAAEDLRRFDDGGRLGPRDLRIKVVAPVRDEPAWFSTTGAGWYRDWLRADPRVRGEMRTYTVRAARPDGERPEVDIDFVLHDGREGHVGPAVRWAAAAARGAGLLVVGPNRRSPVGSGGFEWRPPPPPGPLLLLGDETAVPAVGSILATLPASYVGRVLLEVPTAQDALALPTAADVEVTWFGRDARPRGELLVQAVRDLVGAAPPSAEVPPADDGLLWETPLDLGLMTPAGAPYAWVAGEAGVVRDLRRRLLGEAGLPRASAAFMGYWRAG